MKTVKRDWPVQEACVVVHKFKVATYQAGIMSILGVTGIVISWMSGTLTEVPHAQSLSTLHTMCRGAAALALTFWAGVFAKMCSAAVEVIAIHFGRRGQYWPFCGNSSMIIGRVVQSLLCKKKKARSDQAQWAQLQSLERE
jgi:hypothetical protein